MCFHFITILSYHLVRAAKERKASKTRTTQETVAERHARIEKASTRKIRKLSGWNVFQKKQLEGQSLTKEAYKDRIRDISTRWKSMSEYEKEPYHAEAAVQQDMVESLAQKPLRRKRSTGEGSGASSHECDSQDHLESSVWRKAKKKISCRRLQINEQSFRGHAIWSLPTQYGDSA